MIRSYDIAMYIYSKMSYKDILTEKGFIYDPENEIWKKSSGFGLNTTVDHLMRGLFVIITPQGVIHNGFIESLDEFKDVIEAI